MNIEWLEELPLAKTFVIYQHHVPLSLSTQSLSDALQVDVEGIPLHYRMRAA